MIVLNEQIDRRNLIKKLRDRGIETNVGAYALHILEYFRQKYGHHLSKFPCARLLHEQGLVLPIYGKLKKKDIEFIVSALRASFQR